VIKQRPDRLAAAFLLAALVATLSLLAHPSGRASATVSAPSLDVTATVRYGCAVGTDPGFVEVTLTHRTSQPGVSDQPVVQVGLVGPGHANNTGNTDNVVTDNAPTQVTLTSDRATVRLAGTPRPGDHVMLNRMDQPASYAPVAVPNSCQRVARTDFGLITPDVVVSQSACQGTRASLKVSVTNPNPMDPRLHDLGIDQLDYAVLLVRGSNKQLAGEPSAGQLVSFVANGKQTQQAKIVQTASSPDSYEVQVVGPDGVVEVPGDRRLSCNAVDPHPSPSITLTPVPSSPSHGKPSPRPTHSKPGPSTPAPASTTASSRQPVPSSSSAPVLVPGSPVAGQPGSTSQSTPAKRSSSATHRPPPQTSVPVTPIPSTSQTIAESPRLVSALGLGSGIQRSALLVIAVFAVSMAGLVANTVRNASRR
jgi:hypothetical protein